MKKENFIYYSRFHYKKGWEIISMSKTYMSRSYRSKNITNCNIKWTRNTKQIFQLLRVVYIALHEIFNRVPSLSYIAIDRDDPISKVRYAPYVSKKKWVF